MIRLGLVGIGKIARDQHIPALDADLRFVIAATADRSRKGIDGVANHADLNAMIAGEHGLDAVSLCTPPEGRAAIASAAITAGLHVMLEKPPGTEPHEVEQLEREAQAAGVTLFASWHSRAAAGVAPAREWLAGRRIDRVTINWKEDIRRWHPGQEWILGPGGFGVFDPGINALSILTAILPETVSLDDAQLQIPEGRASPIAAQMHMTSGSAVITAEFDFLQTGPQSWEIDVETDAGILKLAAGGSIVTLPGTRTRTMANREYPALYDRFASLILAKTSDVDVAPLALVCGAMRNGAREIVAPFQF